MSLTLFSLLSFGFASLPFLLLLASAFCSTFGSSLCDEGPVSGDLASLTELELLASGCSRRGDEGLLDSWLRCGARRSEPSSHDTLLELAEVLSAGIRPLVLPPPCLLGSAAKSASSQNTVCERVMPGANPLAIEFGRGRTLSLARRGGGATYDSGRRKDELDCRRESGVAKGGC
jgi:hypothetical protein